MPLVFVFVFVAACMRAGEAAADAARSIAAQLATLQAQAAGQAEELRELQGMKQVRVLMCVDVSCLLAGTAAAASRPDATDNCHACLVHACMPAACLLAHVLVTCRVLWMPPSRFWGCVPYRQGSMHDGRAR